MRDASSDPVPKEELCSPLRSCLVGGGWLDPAPPIPAANSGLPSSTITMTITMPAIGGGLWKALRRSHKERSTLCIQWCTCVKQTKEKLYGTVYVGCTWMDTLPVTRNSGAFARAKAAEKFWFWQKWKSSVRTSISQPFHVSGCEMAHLLAWSPR